MKNSVASKHRESVLLVETGTLNPPSVRNSVANNQDGYTHYLFIFANPLSGDQKAAQFLNKARNFSASFSEHGISAYGHLFSVLIKEELDRGVALLKRTAEKVPSDRNIYVVLMGGDGGLMRAMIRLQNEIDLDRVIFVALPFGTGNDTGLTLGWGGDTSERHLRDMRSIVKEICLNSTETKVNIWQVEMTFRKKGDV